MQDWLQRIDLNLLVTLDVLIQERSVTRAAARMHLGQPAMSASLARLRAFFDDPLLVREGREMVPTPRAIALMGPVRRALGEIESALRASRYFDPEHDARTFRVMASDYVLLVLLGPLLAQLRAEAPHVNFQVVPVAPGFADDLRSGRIDLLVYPDELVGKAAELDSALLFVDRLVVAIDAQHPDVGDDLTLDQFRSLPWVSFGGSEAATVQDERMTRLGLTRPAEIVAQSFVVQPFILQGARFMTLIPERLGRYFAELIDIRLLNPPVDLAPLDERLYWSERAAFDPGHQWLRDRVLAAAANA